MKQTKIYCDLCGREVKAGVNKGSFRLIGKSTRETLELTTLDYQDLCSLCTLKLFFLINKLIKGKK
jgi:hypothetical protein